MVLVCAVLMLGLTKLGSRIPCLHHYSQHVSPLVIPVAFPVGLIAQTGSVWTTVAVTAERYVAVCHPLRAKSLCTYRRARCLQVIVTLAAVVYNIPRFWEVRT